MKKLFVLLTSLLVIVFAGCMLFPNNGVIYLRNITGSSIYEVKISADDFTFTKSMDSEKFETQVEGVTYGKEYNVSIKEYSNSTPVILKYTPTIVSNNCYISWNGSTYFIKDSF